MKFDKDKLYYVASPYSGEFKDLVERNFERVTNFVAKLVKDGYNLISPITYGHVLTKTIDMPNDWQFWQDFCINFLKRCDHLIVLMIPGWDKSVGVREEINFANDNNIPITYMYMDLIGKDIPYNFIRKYTTIGSDVITIPVEYVSDDTDVYSGYCERLHENGWNIRGEINSDYYSWVNYFEAEHKDYGRVWGNFEKEVYADSEDGFNNFCENFPTEGWDYMDI